MFTKVIAPLAAVALFVAAGAAYADTATGKIKSVDMGKHEITLDNGMMFMLDKSAQKTAVRAGETVQLTYAKKGKENHVSAVKVLAD